MNRTLAILAVAAASFAGGARAQDLVEAIEAGKPILEERLRFEEVDQANFTRDAEAFTLRSKIGWETGAWNNLTGAIEGEATSHFGAQDYNDSVDHRTLYPSINDPDTVELHRLQLAWTPTPLFSASIGRQRFNIDDQRFISSPTWRQDEQMFDAARMDTTVGGFSGTYLYISHVARNLAQTADYASKSSGLTLAYAVAPILRVEAFDYALDLIQAPTASTLSQGVRVTGQQALPMFKLTYAASYASQRNYAINPATYHVPYWMGELVAIRGDYSAKVNFESLGSDGKHSFSTPLASLHSYQGWADVFTTTPVRGVDDFNLSATYAPSWKWGPFTQPQFFVRHHDFTVASGSGGEGAEWDASAQANLTRQLTALIKYADYHGNAALPSRRKFWLQFDFNL